MDLFLNCIYSLAACIGFCFVFNLRGKQMFFASLGGAIGWFVYLLFAFLSNDVIQSFAAMVVISIYSEIMARIQKTPVTPYLIVGLLPLVPGGGIYYTMEYCIQGNTEQFIETGLHTLAIAGSLAVAILLVSSVVRLYQTLRLKKLEQ